MYKINDWTVSNVDYVTPKPNTGPGTSGYVTLDIPDLNTEPTTTLTYPSLAPSSTGNSAEIVAKFDDNGTGSHLTFLIDDGVSRAGILIRKGFIALLDGSSITAVHNTDSDTHRYTLTLQNGALNVFFDTNPILSTTTTQNPVSTGILVGFPEKQNGSAHVDFKYIKRTKGIYKYIKLEDVDFELHIDSVDTFDSPNHKVYTKTDFVNPPNEPTSWSPVSFVCGNFTKDGYDGRGLVQAVTVKLPPKQDSAQYTFYYKVRFSDATYTSDFTRTYLTTAVKPTEISETLALSDTDLGYKALNPTADNLKVTLPETPVTDGWEIQLYNASSYAIKVYDFLGYEQAAVPAYTVYGYKYSASADNWASYVIYKPQNFVLPADITNIVFDAVFNHHLPAYDDVYTKVFNSGNAADLIKGNATAINDIYSSFMQASANIYNFKADRDDMNLRWKNVFGLDNSLFKNAAEMRDAMQNLVLNLKGEMLKRTVEYLIYCITGAIPKITEYKDVDFNVLQSDREIKQLPREQTYYLFDENMPVFDVNPFVLYGGKDQAFTWQVDVYDPYNLQYSQELVKQLIDMIKPVYSYVILNFYSYEGVPYTKKYYYGIDNYLEAAYNK